MPDQNISEQQTPPEISGPAYDDEGNLMPGWGLDENGNPVWIDAGYIDTTGEIIGEQQTPPDIEGPAYDDEGNLMPGWGLDENGDPVWVAPGYIDATGEIIQSKQTPSEIQGPAYDDEGNLMPGWGLDENGNPVWVAPGYIDATGEVIQAKQTPSAIEGPAYDDEGNLMPGWSLDEDNNPVWVGNNPDGTIFVEPATQASADQSRAAAQAARGISKAEQNTRGQASSQDQANALAQGDWRVRLQLAPGANYLYKSKEVPGILFPLVATNGVLFPYTPSISVSYAASYDATDLLHSNYKIYQYKSSSVDTISITCDFTAQDTFEANYLLAVIHFFRSVTKMFYGQDQNPTNGTPPPLCYLTGMGAYQFDRHPLAITAFNYSLPTDVDYIQAGSTATAAGSVTQETNSTTVPRQGTGISAGGNPPSAKFKNTPTGTTEPTYVPTKIQLAISAVPIVSRNDISNNFSLKEYGTGSLLRGSKNRGGAGIW